MSYTLREQSLRESQQAEDVKVETWEDMRSLVTSPKCPNPNWLLPSLNSCWKDKIDPIPFFRRCSLEHPKMLLRCPKISPKMFQNIHVSNRQKKGFNFRPMKPGVLDMRSARSVSCHRNISLESHRRTQKS